MIKIKRTDSENPDFAALVKRLDADLAARNGATNDFYAQFNKIDKIKYVALAYEEGVPVGCGAIKEYQAGAMEVKRMFAAPEQRRKGIASRVLAELESWALELGYEKCVLETGTMQPEAIALYKKSGYVQIPNYGQYAGVEASVCFEKRLN